MQYMFLVNAAAVTLLTTQAPCSRCLTSPHHAEFSIIYLIAPSLPLSPICQFMHRDIASFTDLQRPANHGWL